MILPGEFWLANILYTDQKAGKIRPVLVLWLDGNDAVVAVVTTAGPRSLTDRTLTDWRASGLRAPSTVRLSRLDCLEGSLLFKRIGAWTPGDAQQLKGTLDQHL